MAKQGCILKPLGRYYTLNNNALHYIEIYNNSTDSQEGSITETVVAGILAEGTNNIQISPTRSSIYKLEGEESIVEVDTHNENVRVEFYDEEYNLMQYSNNGTEYIVTKDSGRIYVIFINMVFISIYNMSSKL